MLLVDDTLRHATLLPSVFDLAQQQQHPVGNKDSYYSTYNVLAPVKSTTPTYGTLLPEINLRFLE
jgi:hypothetical protein